MSEHDEDAVVERVGMRLLAERISARSGRPVKKLRGVGIVWHSGGAEQAELAHLAMSILSELKPGDRLPGGLRVVPEEPTAAMIRAGNMEGFSASVMTISRDVYRAMIAATTNDRGQNADDS